MSAAFSPTSDGQSSAQSSPNGEPPPPTNGKTNGRRNGVALEADDASASSNKSDESGEEGDDGTLLTVQPGFNRLLFVLRDEKVMRFVMNVSAAAEGSRWDVCGEYEVEDEE